MQQGDGGAGSSGDFRKIGEGLGGLVGQAADAAAGMLGSMMSSMGGWWAQAANQQQAARSFGEEQERACRNHFEASARGGAGVEGASDYERVRPLYQLGHVAGRNPEYRGRGFEEVEPELRRAWSGEQEKRYGSWPEVRGYVDFGFSRGSSAGGAGR